MSKSDLIPIKHMLDAAREATAFIEGKQRADLDRDRMLSLALTRLLEIIGEASRRVTPATRSRFPAVPWQDAADLRNRLIHGYDQINLDLVWTIAAAELPSLIAALEEIPGTEP